MITVNGFTEHVRRLVGRGKETSEVVKPGGGPIILEVSGMNHILQPGDTLTVGVRDEDGRYITRHDIRYRGNGG